MQALHDEGDGGAAGPRSDPPRGLLPYPEGLIARASGWLTPIGRLLGVTVDRIETLELTWDRISIEEMRFTRSAALLLTQGMQLSQLFPPDVTFYDGANPILWFLAPPIIIARRETALFQVPPKVQGVVLGVVVRTKELSEDQIRARMLESLLG